MKRTQQGLKYATVAAVFLGIGLLLSSVLADHRSSGEVRIVAQRSEDGSVRVGLQERGVDGGWGERLRPELGVLPADAPAGAWRASSPLDIGAGMYQGGVLVCVIDHSSAADQFWSRFTDSAFHVAEDMRMNLRTGSGASGAKQAALIDECTDDGALVIATTLAAPDAVAGSIARARAAGVQVLSFNSGAEVARQAGTATHISSDDEQAGRLAGQAFTDAGLTGTLLCVIHEAENVGLETRCDSAEAAYGGKVERVRFEDPGLSDLEAVKVSLADRLSLGDAVGILTLNSQLALPALETIAATDASVQLGTFGVSGAFMPLIAQREMLFMINDQPQLQATLTLVLLSLIGYLGSAGADATVLFDGTQVVIQPQLFDFEQVRRAMASFDAHYVQVDDPRGYTR